MHKGTYAARLSAARNGLVQAALAAAKAKLVSPALVEALEGATHKDPQLATLFRLEALAPIFKELVKSGPKAQTAKLKKELSTARGKITRLEKAAAEAAEVNATAAAVVAADSEVKKLEAELAAAGAPAGEPELDSTIDPPADAEGVPDSTVTSVETGAGENPAVEGSG